jgi:hypothetical protein
VEQKSSKLLEKGNGLSHISGANHTGGKAMAQKTETVAIETITPEEAADLLKTSHKLGNGRSRYIKNRPLRRSHIYQIAQEIAAGQWRYTGESICINSAGKVTDGQHRLHACVVADSPIRTVVARGVRTKDSAEVAGTGRARTMPDALSMAGETSVNNLSAALTKLRLWEAGAHRKAQHKTAKNNGLALSNRTIVDYLAVHPRLRDVVKLFSNSVTRVMPPSTANVCYYIFSHYDAEVNELFWDEVLHGEGLKIGDATYTLRTLLARNQLKPTRERITSDYMDAIVTKAWNAFVEGRQVKHFRFSDTETFPALLYPRLGEFFADTGTL